MKSNRAFAVLAIALSAFCCMNSIAQVTMTPKAVAEQQGMTGHIVTKTPEDYSGQRSEALKIFAEDPEVLQALKQVVLADLKHEAESFETNKHQVATINRIGLFRLSGRARDPVLCAMGGIR